jgi:hypothetical protein
MPRLIASALFVSASFVANAHGNVATLFVANNGTDVAGCGAYKAPCRSISRAIRDATPGDWIVVGPGRYGDLDLDGAAGEAGEESGPLLGCDCMVLVDKPVTLLSSQGATTTVIDAGLGPDPSVVAAVRIRADHVRFGFPRHGFTVTRALRHVGLSIDSGTGVTLAGNISTFNAGGFSIGGEANLVEHNIAASIDGISFDVGGQHQVLRYNLAFGSGQGFLLSGSGHVLTRNASNANATGFDLAGGGAYLSENAAVGNLNAGIYLRPGTDATIRRMNVFGNGTGLISSLDVPRPQNCGIFNRSGREVTTERVYWGTASGPGTDPADAACDAEGSKTLVFPVATRPFWFDYWSHGSDAVPADPAKTGRP